MQKIVPHLWFDKEAVEASEYYVSIFKGSEIQSKSRITGTPSGDCDIVNFSLAGLSFSAISAGPYFQFNPAISLFVVFDNEAEIDEAWKKLSEGGKVLMEYDTYPWAHKYGWLQDKYGLSWQLSWSDNHQFKQRITPLMMFTKEVSGKAKEAIETYTHIFPDSEIEMMMPYTAEDGDTEGYIKHARFSLHNQPFMAMDSSLDHKFSFNEAVSFIVNCETQDEVDYYWNKLSAVSEAEQCGWLKDKYGVSWQIVPTAMGKLMASGDTEKTERVTKAFLQMKKFDIAALEKAYQG